MNRRFISLLIAIWLTCFGYDVYLAYQNFLTHSYFMVGVMLLLGVFASYMIVKNIHKLKDAE